MSTYKIIFGLKRDYVKIQKGNNVSFGGSQMWFEDELISSHGCGLVAMTDLILYLKKTDTTDFAAYKNFLLDFNKIYVNFHLRFSKFSFISRLISKYFGRVNNIDGRMGLIIRKYFKKNKIKFKARWCFGKKLFFKRIEDMLSRDIPAIVAIGEKNGVNYYKMAENKLILCGKISYHYFTVTAISEICEKRMLEISSWGKKYFIYENDMKKFLSCSFTLFSNVLYIK